MVSTQMEIHTTYREGAEKSYKLVLQLKNMCYNRRLKALELPRLVDRRVRGDMIETFKILTGKKKLNARKLFRHNPFNGRSHTMKLYRECPRLNLHKHWYSRE